MQGNQIQVKRHIQGDLLNFNIFNHFFRRSKSVTEEEHLLLKLVYYMKS